MASHAAGWPAPLSDMRVCHGRPRRRARAPSTVKKESAARGGARASSPSFAAKMVMGQVKAALSKSDTSVWMGAANTEFAVKEASMEDYFNRR